MAKNTWFRDELARATAHLATLPPAARLVVLTRAADPMPGYPTCTCGHPGSGCTCHPSLVSSTATERTHV